MNHIEQILSNSLYSSEQFSKSQIDILNEMHGLGISDEQLSVIANPAVSELSYSIISDYLTKGNSITTQEFNHYISRNADRINETISQVYLGKLHGLTDDQIDLYARSNVPNVKVARILIEKCKDTLDEISLNTLITGRMTNSTFGKILIQDLIDGSIEPRRVVLVAHHEGDDFNESVYKAIKTFDYNELKILADVNKVQIVSVLKEICDVIDEVPHSNLDLVSLSLINAKFDSSSTLNRFGKYWEFKDLDSGYSGDFIKSHKYIDKSIVDTLIDAGKRKMPMLLEFIKKDSYLEYRQIYSINRFDKDEFIEHFNLYSSHYNTLMIASTLPFPQAVECIKLKCNSMDEFDLATKYNVTSPVLLSAILSCKKATEIKNLVKLLSDVEDKYIENCITLKKAGYNDETLKLYVERRTKIDIDTLLEVLPSYKTDNEIKHLFSLYDDEYSDNTILNYTKLKNIGLSDENLQYYLKNTSITNNIDILIENIPNCKTDAEIKKLINLYGNYSSEIIDNYVRIKDAGATDEELQYYLDHCNEIKLNEGPVQLDLLRVFMEFNNISLQKAIYITKSNDVCSMMVKKYNYAKTHFKGKERCIGYYISVDDRHLNIEEHLLKNVDNFDDDTFYKIIKYSILFTNWCLKMSSITTNYDDLKRLYESSVDNNRSDVEEFVEKDEPVTADVIIKFNKKIGGDISEWKKILPELDNATAEEVIQDSIVAYFDSSKNFKPIQYDDETLFIDIVGNKKLKGTHIITFNKEEDKDSYDYIFEITHEEDSLNYTAKISTKKDVVDAITKSIALIENIDEYSEYVEELQDMLNSI